MPRSKEISEDLRKKVVEAHQSGKGYKLISKALGLSRTTISSILHKWKRFGTVVTLPRSGRPPKISLQTQRKLIGEVMKNPSMTSKALQATLASANINVHHSTVRRILGIHGRPTLSSFESAMITSSFRSEDADAQETSEKPSDSSDKFRQDIKVEALDESESNSDPGNGGVGTMEEEQPVCQDGDVCHGLGAEGVGDNEDDGKQTDKSECESDLDN